ncbi:CPBP family intramembrane glutamic endopeptidase [Tahibacter amnicola]|uniref:CPBP family intramembrane metalloprotease n=1 Tax=Tahibacter amnicola TaxID=2976241 RepID=A0ABY6BEZ8_9GAMM|nr:CPBP family intramembrane glutamic endopeptidase [Tahibacter amnicola]UXI68357.1 CPBP family intramembrane metalloprotease [Tahibacter amnicola]
MTLYPLSAAGLVPWLFLFSACVVVWIRPWRAAALPLFALAFAAAFAVGQLDWRAVPAFALMGFCAYAVQPGRRLLLVVPGHALFILAAIALRLHTVPGFNNPLVMNGVFSPDTVPFKLYLNLDKTLVVVWAIWAWRHVAWERGPLRQGVPIGVGLGLATAAACLAVASLAGLTRWDPHWPPATALWMLNNLLLVCLTEEVLFRGYVQEGVERLAGGRSWAPWAGIAVSSLLFGITHLGGGWAYMGVTTLAGVGYGLAYRRAGLEGAVLAHATLNLVHFFLFAYPVLAKA